MKNTLLLTEYNLRAIRRPLIWMFVLMGPVQYGVMLAYLIKMKGPLFQPPHRLFMAGMSVPMVCILIGIMLNFSIAMRQNGRSKAIYTLLTLPGKRFQVYFSSVCSGLVTVWLIAAVQALWYILLYVPMAHTIDWYSVHILAEKVEKELISAIPAYSSFVENGFFLHLLRSPAMRMLFPMSVEGLAVMLVSEISVVTSLHSIAFTRGGLRVISAICAIVCAISTAVVLLETVEFLFIPILQHSILWYVCRIAVQLCPAGLAAICAGYSLKHSKVL